MKHNSLITGFDALHRWGHKMNYHVADQNGRGYLCGCFRSIRINDDESWMMTNAKSKANHTTREHKYVVFHRNRSNRAGRRVK